VGRNLTLHPSGGLAAFFDERMDPAQYIPQAYQCDEFLRDGMLILSALPDANIAPLMFPTTGSRLMRELEALPHMGGFGVLARDTTRNGRVWRDVKGMPAITYSLAPTDVALLHDGMVKAARIAFEGGAKRVYPSLVGVGPIESRADIDRFARMDLKPDQFALTSYHPLGTCSMGADPAKHVVDLDHQAHELPGFYIVDGSTVPGALGVNSQITIMAMATRAAQILGDRLA
jgi:choline dehydrogenase-like flavoprotein